MAYLSQRGSSSSAPVLTPEEEALLAAEVPPPDTSMYAAPVEAQYQPGGTNYVAPYDPGAQYGMGSSGGDPAVAWAESQPTDPYNTAPSGTYPSDPIPAPVSGSPYTPGSSALYGAGAVDTFNGGYPVTGGTQPMGFDPDPTTVPPPPTANTGGGASTYYGGTNSARNLGQAVPNATEISTLYPASGGPTNLRVIPPPRTNRYNWDAAEPGPPKPMPDSNPVVTPDMQPVEQAMGEFLPNLADRYGRFFSPVLGLPGTGRTNAGEQVRRVQDTIGGMILPGPEKPASVAGEAGRRAGQTIDAVIDGAAEGLVGTARDGGAGIARLSVGLPYGGKPDTGRTLGGLRAMREQELIPAPEASIPDRMGSWLQTEVIQPGTQLDPALVDAGDWLNKNVIGPLTKPRESTATSQRGAVPAPDLGGRTDMRDENIPSTNPQTALDWEGATTRSLELMKSYSPQDWVAQTKRTAVEIDGVSQKLIEAADAPGLFVGYVDTAGNVVPVGGDVSPEQFVALVKANAAEAPPDWGDVATPTETATTISETVPTPTSTATGIGQPTTLEDVTWTGDTPSSGGGGGSWNDSWSGGSSRSSKRGSSSWEDFDNSFDGGREFTVADFMDTAGGDWRKAELMARFANRRRRSRRKTGSGTSGIGFWDGFPWNRPASPFRQHVLAAIEDSLARNLSG